METPHPGGFPDDTPHEPKTSSQEHRLRTMEKNEKLWDSYAIHTHITKETLKKCTELELWVDELPPKDTYTNIELHS